jgi:hypothetical protein
VQCGLLAFGIGSNKETSLALGVAGVNRAQHTPTMLSNMILQFIFKRSPKQLNKSQNYAMIY